MMMMIVGVDAFFITLLLEGLVEKEYFVVVVCVCSKIVNISGNIYNLNSYYKFEY